MSSTKAKSLKKTKKRDVADSIPARLKEPFISIRDRLHSMDAHRIKASIEVGKTVDALMRAEKKRGKATVIKLAKSLSVSPNELFRLQWLVSRLSDEELAGLQELTMDSSRTLTLTHLILLAAPDSPSRRAELVALTLKESLSARNLALNITPKLLARCALNFLDGDSVEQSLREMVYELCDAASQAQSTSDTLYGSASVLEALLHRQAEAADAGDN